MGKTVGAMTALTILMMLIVGPVYVAVSNSHSFADGGRCTIGQIGCDTQDLAGYRG